MPESPIERAARLWALVWESPVNLHAVRMLATLVQNDVLALSEQLTEALIDANALDLIHRDTVAALAEARKENEQWQREFGNRVNVTRWKRGLDEARKREDVLLGIIRKSGMKAFKACHCDECGHIPHSLSGSPTWQRVREDAAITLSPDEAAVLAALTEDTEDPT